jgi:hypothetical protein
VDVVVTEVMTMCDMSWECKSALVQSFVVDARRLIAEPFACPVWLVNQASSRGLKLSPVGIPRDVDARDCRRFGDGLDACIALGNQDGTGHFLLHTTKSRQKIPQPIVLRFDPDFASLVEAADYRVSRTLHRIVSADGPRLTFDEETRALLERGSRGAASD